MEKLGDGWPNSVIIERGTSIIDNSDSKPILYDAKGYALVRKVGFRVKEN